MFFKVSTIVAYAALTAANPIVPSLNEEATKEAHQRDNGATRFRSDVQIKTSDGNCLTIDKLSGDFRANLTPIQIAPCGSKDGQGFDIITAGKHLDQPNSMLVVSTLTQACFNFDPRRAAGNQALLFSCGGRADGGGQATSSQQFAFSGSAGSLTFEPDNAKGKCFTVKGNALDVANCNAGDAGQKFTIGGAGGGGGNSGGNGGGNNGGNGSGNGQQKPPPATSSPSAGIGGGVTRAPSTTTAAGRTGSTPAPTSPARNGGGSNNGGGNSGGGNNNSNNGNGSGNSIPNPTTPVPVSRAGGKLQPSAAAEAQERDGGAQRSFSNVQIRAPDGRCLFVDPTAGDFRQNLIPVAAAPCAGTPNERFDVVTRGKHNDGRAGGSLLVSSLMNGCVSVDPRRAAGDTVTMFSCGGRADGGGETNSGQLFKIDAANAGGGFTLAPLSDDGKVCVVMGGDGRLVTGPCADNAGQRFEIVQ